MRVEVQESAKKDLKRIDKYKALGVLKKIKDLESYPNLTNIKKLKNYYPPFRYRVGEYRILFDVVEDVLIVINVKHRKDAYE
jgi:mRNA interferase RelE/StbE